jgi:RNA polymerase sigma factor (sigma-70 family)
MTQGFTESGRNMVVEARRSRSSVGRTTTSATTSARAIAQARDREICAMVARDERRAAVAALMDTHGDAVYGFCVRVLRDRSLADDVLQRVFLDAYRSIDRYQERSSLIGWLIGIAGHRCQDALRAQRRYAQRMTSDEQAMTEAADPGSLPIDRLERTRILAALDECLHVLSSEARMTVLLRFQHGKSYEEIAALLDTSVNALQARISRALPVLKRCLEGKGWSHA